MEYPKGCSSFQEAARSLSAKAFPSIEDIGQKAPVCWDGAWFAAEELYRFASCHDTCPGPRQDHTVRLLVGRIANQAIGALDCIERGHYDNALIVCRVLLEQHNVLALLLTDSEALTVFKRSSHSEVYEKLAPRHVRTRLAELGIDDPVIKEVNKLTKELSLRSIHPALEQLATSHMPGHLVAGPLWQPAGFLLSLNELAFVEAAILRILMIKSAFDEQAVDRVSTAINCIVDGLGGLRIDHMPEYLRHNIPKDRWLND